MLEVIDVLDGIVRDNWHRIQSILFIFQKQQGPLKLSEQTEESKAIKKEYRNYHRTYITYKNIFI